MKIFILVTILTGCTFISTKDQERNLSLSGTDFHMHIHTPENLDDDVQFNAERALFAADSIVLTRALLLPNGYSKNANEVYVKQENDFVAKQAEKKRSKLAGACAVNPMQPWAINEIKRCKAIGLEVLKVHFMASGMDLKNAKDYEVAKTYLAAAQDLGFTILVHANYPTAQRGNEIEKLKELIESFPKMRWIIGHLFGREHKSLRNLKHPNFFVEISAAPIMLQKTDQRKELRETIRAVGIKHFIFGSDWPVFHPAETLKYLKLIELNDDELEDILYNNANAFNDLFK